MQHVLAEAKISLATQQLPRVQMPTRQIDTIENGHQSCCHTAQVNKYRRCSSWGSNDIILLKACISRTNNDSDLSNSFNETGTLRKKHPYEHPPKAPATLPPTTPPPFSRQVVAQEWYHPEMTKEIAKQALSGKEVRKLVLHYLFKIVGIQTCSE